MEIWRAAKEVDQRTLWTEAWDTTDIERSTTALIHGHDPVWLLLQELIKLAPGHTCLDHGCGFGRVSTYLSQLGWKLTGVDFSTATLLRVKPSTEFPLIAADIRGLPFGDASFDSAVSLGVVEHLVEGPEVALSELRRCVRTGGVVLITVPYENPVRRATRKFIATRHGHRIEPIVAFPLKPPSDFYQYSFSKKDFSVLLGGAGLHVIKSIPYGIIHGIADLRAFDRVRHGLKTSFGSQSSPQRPGTKASLRGWFRSVYDENNRTIPARIVKSSIGPLVAHMRAYFAEAN